MNQKILKIPYAAFREDWDLLQKFLKMKGNPKYIIVGNVDLRDRQDISDLKNLVGVEGYLWLSRSSVESLGELEFVDGEFDLYDSDYIKTLGKLKKVVRGLDLGFSSIESLGELEYVGGDLYVYNTNIPQIELNNVEVAGKIYR
jgi:glutamine cyclotransferase